MLDVLRHAVKEIPEAGEDRDALRLALRRRQDKVRSYFDELAGKFGRQYVPGRSWQGLGRNLPAADAAAGDRRPGRGRRHRLPTARAARQESDRRRQLGEDGRVRVDLARNHGVKNLEYRLGDLEDLPIKSGTVDLAFFSQSLHHALHPARAVAEAFRILKPGGGIAILDLWRHHFEEARELYADVWLGFTEVEIERYLKSAGFRNVETAVVYREQEAPYFETMLATAEK